MSAPSRIQIHARRPPIFWKGAGAPPTSFGTALWKHQNTTRALRKLVYAGADRNRIKSMLWGLACVKLGETLRATGKKRRSRHVRAPQVQVRRFPERLRAIATEIESLNKKIDSGEVYAGAAQWATFSLPSSHVSDLSLLPDRLGLYATYLESLNRVEAIFKASARRSSLLPLPLELVAEVESLTGKPHFNEIACLLEAAYRANGCEARVNPKALAMQYRRYLKR